MTSKYFSHQVSFDSIVEHNPTLDSWGEYWHLESNPNEKFSWNHNVFSESELEQIMVIGKRSNIKRAETGGHGENCLHHRRSFVSWIRPNKHTSWIFKKLCDLVESNNREYFKFDLTMIEKLQFTYYTAEEEGCYKQHIDPMDWNLPHNRKLSIILQLSNPSEYDGGEIKLYHGYDPIVIPKERGRIIFFPSYTLHEVTPVTRGERYSLVAWVHGPAFK